MSVPLNRKIRTTGFLFLLGPVVFFTCEALAASAWNAPGYSYFSNYVSDLGVPVVTVFQGRAINSPLHTLMNAGFVTYAGLFLSAVLRLNQLLPAGHNKVGVALAISHTVGFVLVAAFPGYEWSLAFMHGVGAVPVIIGGNLAIPILGVQARTVSQQNWFPAFSIGLGVLGLVGLGITLYCAANGIAYQGLFERVAIYSILLWGATLGLLLIRKNG